MKLLLLTAAAILAQDFNLDAPPTRKHQFVAYAAETATVPANKLAFVDLRFVVESGYHVNSHKPLSELQIPTNLAFKPTPGIRITELTFPAGKPYIPAFDPNEKLDVYEGAFTIKVPVIATPGPHQLAADLTYQACDRAACYPPKTLPITILFTAK